MKKTILLSVISLILSTHHLLAHGITVQTEINPPFVIVKAHFSPTSPIVNGSVEVFAPEATTAFQKGRTDTKGHFVFSPDKTGEWKVIIDDERGHKRTAVLLIEENFFSNNTEKAETFINADNDTLCAHAEANNHHHHHSHLEDIPMIYKIVFGLALIFGITGIFYGIKSRKK